MSVRILVFLLLTTLCNTVSADALSIKPDYPDKYVVVKGDTLWDISAKFLNEPWRWPEIWQGNPQINNPHLIYPGDVMRLIQVDGKPQLVVERGNTSDVRAAAASVPAPAGNVQKLSPVAHSSSLDTSIPTIPLERIMPFLTHSYVIGENEAESAGYIISSEDGRLIAGAGNNIYVRGLVAGGVNNYTILRIGKPYLNPKKKSDILGYEATFVGDAKVRDFGDPATLVITESNREALKGDRLVPRVDNPLEDHFTPHPPSFNVEGQIISVLDGASRIGQNQVIIINLGDADGMEVGHVVSINQEGSTVYDAKKKVKLPDERAGIAMVFRTFERVSYALVMTAYRDLKIGDMVGNTN
ncbi:MAG: hypothetical protein A2V90_06905 [Gammaproteobacteria bacterium RBG_16_57_12]|nr:MAG: hypothetical protein A2V90_06905 [Gammaproteobacteria bacterium RBG_16_57_12]